MIKMLVFSIFFLFLNFLKSQEISLSAFIDKKEVDNKEIFKLNLEFNWIGNQSDFRISIPNLPDINGFEMLGSGSSNKILTTSQGQQCTRTIFYNIKGIDIGTHKISNIRALATNTQGQDFNLTAEPILINVIKAIEPFTLDSRLYLFLIALVIIIGLGVFFMSVHSKRKKKELEKLFSINSNFPENKVIDKVRALKSEPERIEQNSKDFFSVLELYQNLEGVNKNQFCLDESKLTFSFKLFLEKINLYRYSNQYPDAYELDELIIKFKEILNKNIETREVKENK
jgi:hypothetical protein